MYLASEKRYDSMLYNRLGTSGLKLPAVSLGLWHNFGNTGRFDNMQAMCFTAFDNGITHFDLANNYGPPEGTAEIKGIIAFSPLAQGLLTDRYLKGIPSDSRSNITDMFSPDFVACCSIASTYKVPYLYCDLTAWNFQQIPGLGIDPDIEFISIPAVCRKSFALDPEKLNDALYSLLKSSTFINFNAETILHQIRRQNYNVSTELMAPFMFCTPAYDMHSFASVYLSAIAVLRGEQYEAAIALADIVLNDALKIWKKGTYHRQLAERIPNAESEYKADAISNYVFEILHGIREIFNQIPNEICVPLMTLTEKSGYSLD